MNKIIWCLVVVVVLWANGAHAQDAIQYLTVVDPNGETYHETSQVTTRAQCESLRVGNLTKAAKLGYKVTKGTYTDPATGISITQSCVDNAGLYEPRSHHPLSGAAPSPKSVDCPNLTPNSAVFPIWGQSNSANHGEGRYTAGPNVVVFSRGACYEASDPLVGATGVDGSPWGRLADRLIAAGRYDKVVLAPFGYGGTFIADWAPGGDRNPGLVYDIQSVLKHGYPITAMLFHQGEADAAKSDFSSAAYTDTFIAMLGSVRVLGVSSPIYIARATTCSIRTDNDPAYTKARLLAGPDEYVLEMKNHHLARAAQLQVANSKAGGGVRPGPNTDTIGPEYRYDGCHFSRRGLEKHADLWFDVLTQ